MIHHEHGLGRPNRDINISIVSLAARIAEREDTPALDSRGSRKVQALAHHVETSVPTMGSTGDDTYCIQSHWKL